MTLKDKNVLITGAAVRVGKAMALAAAQAGSHVVLHYGHSHKEAEETQREIEDLGGRASLLQGDLSKLAKVAEIITQAEEIGPLFAIVNSAAIFEDLQLDNTDLADWQNHLDVNLTAPFLLSQAFARAVQSREAEGRIVNILDWRALRPRVDHLPYTISKAALAALTQSLAEALAPKITVNAMALGAILPPADGGTPDGVLDQVPARRWARLEEVAETLLFLLQGPSYITGEIIYLDGGRHLI